MFRECGQRLHHDLHGKAFTYLRWEPAICNGQRTKVVCNVPRRCPIHHLLKFVRGEVMWDLRLGECHGSFREKLDFHLSIDSRIVLAGVDATFPVAQPAAVVPASAATATAVPAAAAPAAAGRRQEFLEGLSARMQEHLR